MNELFNVKDKVVVITGGAGILGKGIAAYLAKEGAKVVVLDRSEEAGKALVDSIKAEGNEAMFLYTDVMDKEVLEGNKVEIMKVVLIACWEEAFTGVSKRKSLKILVQMLLALYSPLNYSKQLMTASTSDKEKNYMNGRKRIYKTPLITSILTISVLTER